MARKWGIYRDGILWRVWDFSRVVCYAEAWLSISKEYGTALTIRAHR